MNPSKMIRSLCIAVAVLAAAFSTQTLKAQSLVYSQDFDTDSTANWVTNRGGRRLERRRLLF